MVDTNKKNKVLLLNLIALANEQGIAGKTRMQKLIFLIQKKLDFGQGFNYEFIRWHYGPYSPKLGEDLEFLIKRNFIEVNQDNHYVISSEGEQFLSKEPIQQLLENITPRETFENVLEGYNNLELRKLLDSVYKDFEIETKYDKGDTIIGAR